MKKRNNPTVEVKSVREKEVEDGQSKVEDHAKVEHAKSERKAHDGREEVEIDRKLGARREKFIEMMKKFKLNSISLLCRII